MVQAYDPYFFPMDIRSQLSQYQATTGRYEPAILEPMARGRLAAIYEAQRGRKALALQERSQESQESQYAQSLASQQSQFGENLSLRQQELEAQSQAARAKGITDIATLGIQAPMMYAAGKQLGWWGGQTAAQTASTPLQANLLASRTALNQAIGAPSTQAIAAYPGAAIGAGTAGAAWGAGTQAAALTGSETAMIVGGGTTGGGAVIAAPSATGATGAAGATTAGSLLPAAGAAAVGATVGSMLAKQYGEGIVPGGKAERSVIGGVVGGAAVGFAVGGPPGAIVGAVVGAAVGFIGK